MTKILRTCPTITRNIQNDGDKAIILSPGFGHYAEAILYHTFLHGLCVMLYDGSVTHVAPVSAYGGLANRGQVTINMRIRSGEAKKAGAKANDNGVANKYWVIEIPEEEIARGPLYSPELNATLFLPQHVEFAEHPGDPNTIRRFLDAEVAERLNHMGHSGIVINAIDNYKRIDTLYTCLHGRIVAIPVRYRVPTRDEQMAMRTNSLSGETDPDGDPVQPYERIRITYVLERKNAPYGRDLLETVSYSIPKLLRKNPNCWQLGGQWFASDPVALRRKLAEDPAPTGELGFTQETVNNAIADAVRGMKMELDIARSEIQVVTERAKRAEDAFKRLKDLPARVANGEYDVPSVELVHAETQLKHDKIEADRATAVATMAKARAVMEKAQHDQLTARWAEIQKTRQAVWEALEHVAKFALAGIMFYAAIRGIAVKKA